MAKLTPTVLAFFVNYYHYFIFRKPIATTSKSSPISTILFLLGTSLLILDTRLYPRSLRSLHRLISYVYEFVVSVFVMETAFVEFWIPFEIWAIEFLPKCCFYVLWLANMICGYRCKAFSETVLKYVQSPTFLITWRYSISLTYFFSVLHATRIADFRILAQCGPKIFIRDLLLNLNQIKKRFIAKMRNKKKL